MLLKIQKDIAKQDARLGVVELSEFSEKKMKRSENVTLFFER